MELILEIRIEAEGTNTTAAEILGALESFHVLSMEWQNPKPPGATEDDDFTSRTRKAIMASRLNPDMKGDDE